MADTIAATFLIGERGTARELGAFVVAARFDRAGRTVAFALGDGSLRLVELADRETWREVAAHEGAALALAPDASARGFVSGGDDGVFCRVGGDGAVAGIASFGPMKWVEHVVSHPGDKGLLACAVGKQVHLFDATGTKLKVLDHPSTVTGLVFDAKGKRVAASHYQGATLWFVGAKTDTPRRLEWKGSHTAIAIHPEGEALVTAMQENALHGWRLSDGQHMRMSGYPTKTLAMSFTRTGKWLATSGADAMVIWPFFGGGPMGKAPLELAGGDGVICGQVACHPREDLVAGGFNDGLVVLADINSSRILPVAPPEHGPVSVLAWSSDGAFLAIGTETGHAAIVDFTKR